MKTVIHVNQQRIRRNRQTGEQAPVLTVKTYRSNRYAHAVEIRGPSRVVYRPDRPLACGARCWIETLAEVILDPQGAERTPSGVCSCPGKKKAGG